MATPTLLSAIFGRGRKPNEFGAHSNLRLGLLRSVVDCIRRDCFLRAALCRLARGLELVETAQGLSSACLRAGQL